MFSCTKLKTFKKSQNFGAKKQSKKRKNFQKTFVKTSSFLTSIFEGFWSQIGWILGSKLGLKKLGAVDFFPSCVQEASKRLPRAHGSVPRAAQKGPRACQGAPERARERPKSSPKGPQSVPRAPKNSPRVRKIAKIAKIV